MTRDLSLMFMRILVGGIFLLAGISKLIEPIEEFIYVIQSYQFLPEVLIPVYAFVLPPVEVIIGFFIIVGLYERFSNVIGMLMLLSFIVGISWTFSQGIVLDNCGCFGGALAFLEVPADQLLVRDLVLFAFSAVVFQFSPTRWSFDRWIGAKKLNK